MNASSALNDSLSSSRPADERMLVQSVIRRLQLHQALAGMALVYDLGDDGELPDGVGDPWSPRAEPVLQAAIA